MLTVITNSLKLANQSKKAPLLLSITLLSLLSFNNILCAYAPTGTSFSSFLHSCLIVEDSKLRCWGLNQYGQLGYNRDTLIIGDNETIASAGEVNVGDRVSQVAIGGYHTCVLLEDGKARCWGQNGYGQLGYGHTEQIGDDEPPVSAGNINLGSRVEQIATGEKHTCALLEGGNVRCWGDNERCQLGYGHTEQIGDDEPPASAGNIDLGGVAEEITIGGNRTCVLLEGGKMRCWGNNQNGQLGYGDEENICDDETLSNAGDIELGGTVQKIAVGEYHTCALLESGRLRCWGWNERGLLGYEPTRLKERGDIGYAMDFIGDDEVPAAVEAEILIGGEVIELIAGKGHTCALLEGGRVRCWGWNEYGQLGYGHREDIGDDEIPASGGDIDLGGTAQQVAANNNHTCTLLESGEVICWGSNRLGLLGYGHTWDLTGKKPADIGPLPVGAKVIQLWR